MSEWTIAMVRDAFNSVNVIDETREIMQENADTILEMNKDQLLHGMDAEGRPMPELSTTYEGGKYREQKEQMNPEAEGRWDIRLTGDTQANMVLMLNQGTYEITSTDPKTDMLKDKARKKGAILFGIDPMNEAGLIDNIIQPQLVERIAEITQSDAQ